MSLDRLHAHSASIAAHAPLVRRIAWRLYNRSGATVEIDDLLQIGMMALIEALNVYEVREGASLAAYAAIRVRGALIDHLRKQAPGSRRARAQRRLLERYRALLRVQLMREPSTAECAAAAGMALDAYHAAVRDSYGLRWESLDEHYSDHSLSFADAGQNPVDAFDRSRNRDRLAAAMSQLPEREARTLQLYFLEDLKLDEVGRRLGVGSARACQIKQAGLKRLHGLLTRNESGLAIAI